jgi:predicted nuclease of predicted toxin-antitoxin system
VRFLVDASLPRPATTALRHLGHGAVDVRDIGMRSATDDVIAAHARANQQALITRDFDFADIRNYPPANYTGIVVLQLPNDATAAHVVKLLETFVRREDFPFEFGVGVLFHPLDRWCRPISVENFGLGPIEAHCQHERTFRGA